MTRWSSSYQEEYAVQMHGRSCTVVLVVRNMAAHWCTYEDHQVLGTTSTSWSASTVSLDYEKL